MDRMYFFNLSDVRKDLPKLPSPWIVIESTDSLLSVGTRANYKIAKSVKVLDDLSTSVQVFGMSATHLDNKVGTIPLKSYLTQLDALHACPSVTDPELQQFAKMPTTPNKSAQTYFLRATYSFPPTGPLCTTCVRSKDCHLLSKEVICVKCTQTDVSDP